jgi:hypothetical protein
MRQIVDGLASVDAMFLVVVAPAATVTESAATGNSFLYIFMVYVPGFIRGDVYCPPAPAIVQYWAALLYQCKTVWNPCATPVAMPDTVPRLLLGTYP